MQGIDAVWVVERDDGYQRWTGIVDICKSRLEALSSAYSKAQDLADGEAIDFGTTEQIHPVRSPKNTPAMHPCEYVVVRDCIWHIHHVPL